MLIKGVVGAHKMKRKSQGLSLTTLIIAAIALLVLIVLIAIFSGNIRNWGSDYKACNSRGGKCESRDCIEGEVEVSATCPEGKHCCVGFLEEND